MSLVPTTYRNSLSRSRSFTDDFHLYPYLWDDPYYLWPSRSPIHPMDELVTRRVWNQFIQSAPFDWVYPMRWSNCYAGERVRIDENGFHVDLDVRQFKPHEITVKTTDEYITVYGCHDRRRQGDTMIERRFVRKYLLPRGFNANDIISTLSADGILTIKVPPPLPSRSYNQNERLVKVRETGRLALPEL